MLDHVRRALVVTFFALTALDLLFTEGSSRANNTARSSVNAGGFFNAQQVPGQSQAVQSGCVECHKTQTENVPGLFARSTHARNGLTCSGCHGGDTQAADKSTAHSGNFVGRPDAMERLSTCGKCHVAALATFKTSRHFPESRNTPRVECTQCHGVHTIGSPARSFSFNYYCAGCHGLEYLPSLPVQVRDLLSQTDDIRSLIRDLEESGRRPSEDVLRRRKEMRRQTGQVVHSTDLKGGLEKLPGILKRAEELKSQIERELRQKAGQ